MLAKNPDTEVKIQPCTGKPAFLDQIITRLVAAPDVDFQHQVLIQSFNKLQENILKKQQWVWRTGFPRLTLST